MSACQVIMDHLAQHVQHVHNTASVMMGYLEVDNAFVMKVGLVHPVIDACKASLAPLAPHVLIVPNMVLVKTGCLGVACAAVTQAGLGICVKDVLLTTTDLRV
mmetsp:Transcript_13949/g.35931  ORF Transcript_13949/g.35931 Transcript_13949/m.35931 type:complete len:103 (+) Transcript_13949:1095-1403(+)